MRGLTAISVPLPQPSPIKVLDVEASEVSSTLRQPSSLVLKMRLAAAVLYTVVNDVTYSTAFLAQTSQYIPSTISTAEILVPLIKNTCILSAKTALVMQNRTKFIGCQTNRSCNMACYRV